jgi:hypothetical protein
MGLRRYVWVLGVLGLLALIGAGSVWYVTDAFDGRVSGLLGLGSVCLLAYAALDREGLQEATSSRSFSYTTGSLLLQALFLMIGIVLYVLAERYDTTFDLSESGAHTLSDHTQKVLDGIEEPVQMLAFFNTRQIDPDAERLIRELGRHENLELEWVDPYANPQRARMYDVTDGALILQQGERTERLLTDLTERRIVEQIVVVQSEGDHIVCWSSGHSEIDADDETERGLSSAVLAAESLNYQVIRQHIATAGISRECEALVIAHPRQDWLPYEREALAAYLAEGGGVMVLLDDNPAAYRLFAEMQGRPPPATPDEFVAELQRYGITVGDDIVVDPDPANQFVGVEDGTTLTITGPGIVAHPITSGFGGAVIVSGVRSVTYDADQVGIAHYPLLRASTESWAETDPLLQELSPGPEEVTGEVPLAVWAEVEALGAIDVAVPGGQGPGNGGADGAEPGAPRNPLAVDALTEDIGRAVPADFQAQTGGKLVVYGDVDWASNVWIDIGNNRDLFLNTLAWLVEEEDQLGQRPQEGETLEASEAQVNVLCLVSLLFVPGTAAAFAVVTLMRRRYM